MRARTNATFVVGAAVAMAALTWVGGWMTVPLFALAAAFGDRRRLVSPWTAALAAALAWSALLLFDAGGGRMSALSAALGGVMRVPGAVLALVTVAFVSLLAWSAAVVGGALGRLMVRRRA